MSSRGPGSTKPRRLTGNPDPSRPSLYSWNGSEPDLTRRRAPAAPGRGRGVVRLPRPPGLDRQVERQPAVLQHQHAVGEGHRLDHVVGDQHRGEPLARPDPGQEVVHLHAGQRVEGAERLVEEEQPRPADQGAGQGHALPLPAGEHRRPVAGPVGEADVGQRPLGPPAPARVPRDPHVAHHPLPGQQPRVLEQHAHAGRQADDRLAVEQQPAGGRRLQPGEQAQERALAAARAPDDRHEPAGRDGEVDPLEHGPVAEALDHAIEPDRQTRRRARARARRRRLGQDRARSVEEIERGAHGSTPAVWWAGCQARQRRSSARVRTSASFPSKA